MAERKYFLANPKHQDRISQCKEHDYSDNNKMNGDYYEYPSCLILQINFDYKELGGKKSFSCKFKASRSCILIWRT